MHIKKQGFASLSKTDHKKVSSKGGSRRVPKGFSTLPPKERSDRAREAANARWEKARRSEQIEQPTNSAEDGRVKIAGQ